MIDLLFIALFQAAAGEAPPPEASPLPPVSEGAAPEEAPSPEPRVVCRREATTGSNRITRVCRTVEQREDDAAASREAFEDFQRQRRVVHPPGFGRQ